MVSAFWKKEKARRKKAAQKKADERAAFWRERGRTGRQEAREEKKKAEKKKVEPPRIAHRPAEEGIAPTKGFVAPAPKPTPAPATRQIQPAKQPLAPLDPNAQYRQIPGGVEKIPANELSRTQNVVEVMKIALNPFSEDKIVATSGSKIFNSVAEFVANHPYTTALVLATGGRFIKGKLTKPVLSDVFSNPSVFKKGALALSGRVGLNTATKKLVGNSLVKSGFTLIAASYIIKEAVETYPFAKFEIAEAMDKIGYARNEARKNGREDLVEGLNQLQEEILNPEGWEKFWSMMPWANIQRAAVRNIETAIHATQVYSKIDEIEAVGGTEDEKWARVRQEQAEQEKANIDYYNSERKKMLDWEREAKKEARNEDAEFWRKERAKQRQNEAADRIAIAQFWEEYRRKKQLIAENNRPSNLKFGLL